jgi:hypothetical protein
LKPVKPTQNARQPEVIDIPTTDTKKQRFHVDSTDESEQEEQQPTIPPTTLPTIEVTTTIVPSVIQEASRDEPTTTTNKATMEQYSTIVPVQTAIIQKQIVRVATANVVDTRVGDPKDTK